MAGSFIIRTCYKRKAKRNRIPGMRIRDKLTYKELPKYPI